VKKALLPCLQEAITAERRTTEAQLSERKTDQIASYQALKKHVVDAPKKSCFDRAAVENDVEEAVARLLDEAKDVTGWVYNHRSGVGYCIEYDWQGCCRTTTRISSPVPGSARSSITSSSR